jgi:hypothetical protein
MKITRAQKDAVISLLKEKFDEKQKLANEAYEKTNKSKINAESKAFLQDQDKLESLLFAAKEIISKWKDNENRFISAEMSVVYGWNWQQTKEVLNKYSEEEVIKRIKHPSIQIPDYNKVARQLELDTLSKDFDLDKFIKKYLD